MKKTTLFFIALSIFALSVSCGRSDRGGVRGVKHVVVVGFDGLAGNVLDKLDMPTLQTMVAEGAWTAEARSILPSSSACNWASMYMGVGPEMHGFNTWGSRKPDFPSVESGKNGIFPTILTVLRDHDPDMDICAMYEWDVQGDLIDSKAATFHKHIPMGESRSKDITDAFTAYLAANKPEFSMVIYDSPDVEGHKHGWGSEPYMDRMRELDAHLARIVDATKQAGMYDRTIFMIVSDHGGTGSGHGGTTMDEMEAPLIFFGRGVKRGHEIEASVMRYDTAPTIAYIFGAATPDAWRGKAIKEIFE